MKKLSVEVQREINGGWCVAFTRYLGSYGDHYYNGRYSHRDWYRSYSGGWYYYG